MLLAWFHDLNATFCLNLLFCLDLLRGSILLPNSCVQCQVSEVREGEKIIALDEVKKETWVKRNKSPLYPVRSRSWHVNTRLSKQTKKPTAVVSKFLKGCKYSAILAKGFSEWPLARNKRMLSFERRIMERHSCFMW